MSQQTDRKPSFKSTLNLPRTTFAMKANLVQNEPATLRRWQASGLYRRVRDARAGAPRFVFHDGPPYANGDIHLGHLLNKVLKDFVVRAQTMAGRDCPYVPGWDCHGLPIEHKVLLELGERARDMVPMQIRHRCRSYAEKFVKVQSGQMQRLLTLADYDDPYLTMDPAYEAATLEVFADLVRAGVVYRDLKPVHWSVANRTALAEAELEYADREDTSVYVLFQFEPDGDLREALGAPPDQPLHLMIWTTTPWTLPANLAVAVHAAFDYGLYRVDHAGRAVLAVVATDLAPQVLGAEAGAPLGTVDGARLLGATYRHPFVEHVGRVVGADYVTLADGTGLVHTAPGHGVEDYQTGLSEGLPIYCPVREDGTFDDSVPDWLEGVDVWQANDLIVEHLRHSGHLYHAHRYRHSYPHDWRSKTPVIFRATEQWFVGVDRPLAGSRDTLRATALAETADRVHFIPAWGRNRMRGMLESRPDWCLSRQRAWGLPIPAFFGAGGSQWLLTPASVRAVAERVRQAGSNAWFTEEPDQLLAGYDPAADPDAPDWLKAAGRPGLGQLRKSLDIFDVWFESGSSWNAVIRQRFGDGHYPTDLYLEGSDQHRGWFQLSLLPALGATGQSPFRRVLTHGFMVDRDGRKMSKSLGNALAVEELFKRFGADVCRWWVASLNTDNDIKVDLKFFEEAGDAYRKVRNTIRFLLGNLSDFDPEADRHGFGPADAATPDAWALAELDGLITTVRDGYEQLQYRTSREALFDFCNDTLSAVYLAAVKDRLYCDRASSLRRRRCQTTLHAIADALIRMLAPILPHTAEEAWAALHGAGADSVHLALLPAPAGVAADAGWAAAMREREAWLKAIESARQSLGIDNPLDCGLSVAPQDEAVRAFDAVDLADLCGISRFTFAEGEPSVAVLDLRAEPRCERSWKRDGTVKARDDGGMLSDRDADALGP